jgi:hypothetical protein
MRRRSVSTIDRPTHARASTLFVIFFWFHARRYQDLTHRPSCGASPDVLPVADLAVASSEAAAFMGSARPRARTFPSDICLAARNNPTTRIDVSAHNHARFAHVVGFIYLSE